MSARGMEGPVVALTGTPGTGKTAVAAQLRSEGFPVLDLKLFVGDPRFDLGEDPLRPGARILDEEVLSDHLREHLLEVLGIKPPHVGPVFIESHFAHDLDIVDRIIVLRCHPSILKGRLAPRGWPDEKVRENLEAEALDLIVQEALAVQEDAATVGEQVAVGEVDTSEAPVDAVARRILAFLEGPPDSLEIGTVDWSDEVLGWF